MPPLEYRPEHDEHDTISLSGELTDAPRRETPRIESQDRMQVLTEQWVDWALADDKKKAQALDHFPDSRHDLALEVSRAIANVMLTGPMPRSELVSRITAEVRAARERVFQRYREMEERAA